MAAAPAKPGFEQVRALPTLLEREVPRDYEDFNGHMSITHYMGIQNEAGPAVLAEMGLTEEHIARNRTSIFDAEHHLLYFGEVMVGDMVSVHMRTLDRSGRAVHGVSFLCDLTREEVANSLEFVSIHVDLEDRRPAPWPEEIAARLDELIGADRELGWEPPLCGSMGVRSSQ